MKYEIGEIVISQNFTHVFKQDIMLIPGWKRIIIEIPPGVLSSDYVTCKLEIKRKGDKSI
jgi:hypothetical protein